MTEPEITDEMEVELRRLLGLLTEHEVAAIAGNDITTIRNWRSDRTGPPFTKLGRRPLYRVERLKEWLERRETETT